MCILDCVLCPYRTSLAQKVSIRPVILCQSVCLPVCLSVSIYHKDTTYTHVCNQDVATFTHVRTLKSGKLK